MSKVQEIVSQLQEWSDAYYAGDAQVDDVTFDALEDELRKLDFKNEWFNHVRERVGGYGTKIAHKYGLVGSIGKIHTIDESKILGTEETVVLSAKLDGTSLVAYFQNGKLLYALTRGDGYYGLDVTSKFLAITKKYRMQIPENFTGRVRGEVVFTTAQWEVFRNNHPEAKAPRNSGTGMVNGKEDAPELSLLDWVVYEVVGEQFIVKDEWLLLEQFNVPTAPHYCVPSCTVSHTELEKQFENWSAQYPLDGVVIKAVKEPEQRDNAFIFTALKEAYKFQAETQITEVLGIEWSMGMTGKLTPVLQVKPVLLSGAVVQNVTGHNAGLLKEGGCGVGATIVIQRANEVIPKIVSVVKPTIVEVPTCCPYCGAQLEVSNTDKDIVCTNSDCPELQKQRLFNYIVQVAKDVKGIGPVFVENFVASFQVTSILELLIAVNSWDRQPLPLLGNADNKVALQVASALKLTDIDPEKFLLGLGVRFLGTVFAKELANNTPALQNLFNVMANWRPADLLSGESEQEDLEVHTAVLSALPGRDALAKSVTNSVAEVGEILRLIIHTGGSFAFKTTKSSRPTKLYAITGTLSKSRKELVTEFASAGWEMTETISKSTVLINNDINSTSSKNKAAHAAGIPIITEDEFRTKYINL